MEILYPDCAGLDVHKDSVYACRRHQRSARVVETELRVFATTTRGLTELGDWLEAQGVPIAVMESTGVYWLPLFNLLEDRLTLWLVNAAHVKQVPGRKTDKRDSEWLAELLSVGLLSPSFVPPRAQRELRELTRQRAAWRADRAQVANRLQKVLEAGNCKLGSVASDPLGVSGQAILEALIAGEEDPEVLADLARGRLRDKRAALVEALRCRLSEANRAMLADLLDYWRYLGERLAALDARIAAATADQAAVIARLTAVPGVGPQVAEVVLAEVGPDVAAFASDAQLCSWAGVCPGNHESAGKRHSGRCTGGNRWLQAALNQAAWAASHSRDTYLGAKFHHWRRQRGGKRAAVATAHLLLRILWHLLAEPALTFCERGPDAVRQHDEAHLTRHLVRRLERLGHHVTLAPLEDAA